MVKVARATVFAVTLALLGCGGGGGGGGGSQPPASTPPPAGSGGNDSGGEDDADPLGAVGTVEEERARLFAALGEDVIAANYSGFEVEMLEVKAAFGTFCVDPAANDVVLLRSAWRDAMGAWQKASIIRFGPVARNNREFRINLFPDGNDAVTVNTNQVLDGTTELTEANIANSAVGAQGLPALEYLLFELGFADSATATRRCEFGIAVSDNLTTLAGELRSAWETGGATLTDFLIGTGATGRDNLVALLESIAVTSEIVGDRKLLDAITAGDTELLESERSETSLDNINANAEALQEFINDEAEDTYRLRDYIVRAHMATSEADLFEAELESVRLSIDSFGENSLAAVIGGMATGDADALRIAFQQLADLTVDIAVASGVNLGFNNQDGD